MSIHVSENNSTYRDLVDPALYRDFAWHDEFRRLRAEDPVHRTEDSPYGPFWSVTRFADIQKVELDHATYSSAADLGGVRVENDPQGEALVHFMKTDPPVHTGMRKTVSPIVHWNNIEAFEPLIRERTEMVLDGLKMGEEINWVQEVSVPLTTMMLATLLDFPLENREKLRFWTEAAVAELDDPEVPFNTNEERMAIMREMAATFLGMLEERRTQAPNFDLISLLAHSERAKDMPAQEFMGNMGLLLVGGNDTTRNSMSGGVKFMHDNPEEMEKLRAEPSLMPTAIAEIIRYHTPVLHMRRTAVQDGEIGGKQIAKGDKVVMWYMSGNKDDDAFDDPYAFKIDRPNARRHLSFGAGIHRCLGARIAEQQLRILWEEILNRDLDIKVTGEPKRMYSNFVNGINGLPVVVSKRKGGAHV